MDTVSLLLYKQIQVNNKKWEVCMYVIFENNYDILQSQGGWWEQKERES